MQTDIIKTVREELKLNSSAAVRLSAKKFFREEAKHYGVKSAVVGVSGPCASSQHDRPGISRITSATAGAQ